MGTLHMIRSTGTHFEFENDGEDVLTFEILKSALHPETLDVKPGQTRTRKIQDPTAPLLLADGTEVAVDPGADEEPAPEIADEPEQADTAETTEEPVAAQETSPIGTRVTNVFVGPALKVKL